MEPKRAAFEIGLQYTCGSEIGVPNEVPSSRNALAGIPERSRVGVGNQCVERATLRLLLSDLAAASNARYRLRRGRLAEDVTRGYRCRRRQALWQGSPDACALYHPS